MPRALLTVRLRERKRERETKFWGAREPRERRLIAARSDPSTPTAAAILEASRTSRDWCACIICGGLLARPHDFRSARRTLPRPICIVLLLCIVCDRLPLAATMLFFRESSLLENINSSSLTLSRLYIKYNFGILIMHGLVKSDSCRLICARCGEEPLIVGEGITTFSSIKIDFLIVYTAKEYMFREGVFLKAI